MTVFRVRWMQLEEDPTKNFFGVYAIDIGDDWSEDVAELERRATGPYAVFSSKRSAMSYVPPLPLPTTPSAGARWYELRDSGDQLVAMFPTRTLADLYVRTKSDQ